jgi:hypothetical protein
MIMLIITIIILVCNGEHWIMAYIEVSSGYIAGSRMRQLSSCLPFFFFFFLFSSISVAPNWSTELRFTSVSSSKTADRTPWMGDQPVARTLSYTSRHPCLEWDLNPRSQC